MKDDCAAENANIKKRYNAKKEWVPIDKRLPRNGSVVLVLFFDGMISLSSIIKKKKKLLGITPNIFQQPHPDSHPLMWRYSLQKKQNEVDYEAKTARNTAFTSSTEVGAR